MLSSLPTFIFVCVAAGILSHNLYWSRHEFDDHVPQILLGAIFAYATLTATVYGQSQLADAFLRSLVLFTTYVVSVLLSVCIYRLVLHPLRKYRGPFWARLWAWWKVRAIARSRSHYVLVDKLHGQYGEIVRVGPNNLSICNAEALHAIYGSQSPCTKSPQYLIGGLVSVQSERNPHRHRLRRAVWDKALGTQASNSFFPRLTQLTDLLAQKIAEHGDKDICVNDWMHFITFDVMAQFCFSRDWGQLASGKIHAGIKFASDYLRFAIYGTQVPWLAVSLMKIPHMPEPQTAMMEFSAKALDERSKKEPEIPDAMSYILAEKDPQAQQFLSRHDLESDVFMIMLAGADTSFSVLVNLCFRLAASPEYQDKLRREVSSAFRGSPVDWSALSSASFLGALINETLRLHPPVPSGMGRVTPPEGLIIPTSTRDNADVEGVLHIPGKVVVSVPTYSLHRSSRYWSQPDAFIPERWTSRPELILDRKAWCPFSLGAYGCAGKYFALMEIRLVIARLVHDFDISFTKDWTQPEIEDWLASQSDWMTLQPDKLRLKFMRRSGSG